MACEHARDRRQAGRGARSRGDRTRHLRGEGRRPGECLGARAGRLARREDLNERSDPDSNPRPACAVVLPGGLPGRTCAAELTHSESTVGRRNRQQVRLPWGQRSGDRFAALRGRSEVLQGKGASNGETRQIAGKARYQALCRDQLTAGRSRGHSWGQVLRGHIHAKCRHDGQREVRRFRARLVVSAASRRLESRPHPPRRGGSTPPPRSRARAVEQLTDPGALQLPPVDHHQIGTPLKPGEMTGASEGDANVGCRVTQSGREPHAESKGARGPRERSSARRR